jgi:hypothetical protein
MRAPSFEVVNGCNAFQGWFQRNAPAESPFIHLGKAQRPVAGPPVEVGSGRGRGLVLAAFGRCLPFHWYGLRCTYAEAGLLAASADNDHLNVVAYTEGLADSPG